MLSIKKTQRDRLPPIASALHNSQSSYWPALPLLVMMTNIPAVTVNNNFDLVRDCPPAQSNKEEEPSMNNNTVAK